MLIDPQGLFYGERISACSDEAQLHFPRLMAAANGYGRIEMSVSKLHATVYAGFRAKPTREQLMKWFREYHENFLLFVYRANTGEVWGQWAVSKGKLPKWKTAEDNRSPAPPPSELEAYQKTYIEAKRAKYEEHDDHISISEGFGRLPKTSEGFKSLPKASEDFQRLSKTSEGFGRLSQGEVVGEVVGVGEVEVLASPAAPPVLSLVDSPAEAESLHANCRSAILTYWSEFVQPDAEPVWDGSEGKALSDLLRAMPALTLTRFRAMLKNRGGSDVNQCERPRKWIPSLPSYENGPLDAFGKPKALRLRVEAGVVANKAPNPAVTAIALRAEDAARQHILDDWRDVRARDPAGYERDAPRWVRDELSGDSRELAEEVA